MSHAWMPLYIADYLADTVHLTAAEHGAYLLLIMRYWQDGGLPTDERLIARYSRLTPDQWGESRDVLAALFDDGWKHHRIDGELARAEEIVTKRKAAASSRYNKRPASEEHVQSKSTYVRVPPSPSPTEADASVAAEVAAAPKDAPASGRKGTRLPADWEPSAKNEQDALELGLPLLAQAIEARKFRDYWLGKSGRDATKVDWDATWRLWVTRACEQRGATKPPASIAPVAPVVWIHNEQPEWPAMSDRWQREKGTRPTAMGSRNGRIGQGYYFPADWLSAQPERTEA